MKNSKKKLVAIAGVLVCILLVLVIAGLFQNNESDTDEPGNFAANPSQHLSYIGIPELYDIVNDTSGVGHFVYIGTPECPNCQLFEPTLTEVLQNLDRELAYFRTDLAFATEADFDVTVMELIAPLGVEGVPTIVYIVNGEAIDLLIGNQAEDVVIAFFEAHGF